MKKRNISLLLLSGLLLVSGLSARAETYRGEEDWHVAFTAEEEMESSFKTADLNDLVQGMQPGDNVIITLALKNEHQTTTDWYMRNEVLYSLEDRSANSATGGGAYTYRLNYTDKDGTVTTLFDSDTVGGDVVSQAGEGLKEATDALGDYFYLDTLTKDQAGAITLEVALDGETQGNDYQDTLADLQMDFAVELRETPAPPGQNTPKKPDGKLIKTGDEINVFFHAALTALSGLVRLLLSVYEWKQ